MDNKYTNMWKSLDGDTESTVQAWLFTIFLVFMGAHIIIFGLIIQHTVLNFLIGMLAIVPLMMLGIDAMNQWCKDDNMYRYCTSNIEERCRRIRAEMKKQSD